MGSGNGHDFDWSGYDSGLDISDDEFAQAILAGRRAEALSSADPFGIHRK
ncbi:MAG: hypothetical protein HKN26_10685 [Acidimicrobiales bacterium]|nr:hypothetical protein [Acidimicrobiales bacterium]